MIPELDEYYTAIWYNTEGATLVISVQTPSGSHVTTVPIAEFLTSTTDLPIIITPEGSVDVKQ